MAKGDSKNSRGRRGGSGSYRYYDDEGRGNSKYYWEEFESWFKHSDYSQDWLMGGDTKGVDPTIARLFTAGNLNRLFNEQSKSLLIHGLYDGRLYAYVQSMRARFNVHDWAWQKFEDDDDKADWRKAVLTYLVNNPKKYATEEEFISEIQNISKLEYDAVTRRIERITGRYIKTKGGGGAELPSHPAGSGAKPLSKKPSMDNLQESLEEALTNEQKE